jgi:hypothetical protein
VLFGSPRRSFVGVTPRNKSKSFGVRTDGGGDDLRPGFAVAGRTPFSREF